MKLRNRILAILLTLALMLSVMPMAFAAEQVTVTLSTPSGTTTHSVAAGAEFTFPTATDYEDYLFFCWVTKTFESTDGSDVEEYYFAEETLSVTSDRTFYALYLYEASQIEVPYFFWTGNLEDYSGEYAIVGYDADYTINDYDYDLPQALGERGQSVDVNSSPNAVVFAEESEFISSGTNFVYDFALQSDGTYTIRNLETGKYLSAYGTTMAFYDTPDASSYWNITLDDYGYDTIVNAKNSKLVLLYDYMNCCFGIYDDSRFYAEDYYPTDLFFIALYARVSVNYRYTTQVPGVEPEPPIELPDHDCPSVKYTDLELKAWYHDGVDFVLANGYMNGVNSNTFRPNGTLNRAMVATVLYRIAGEPAVEGTSSFSDVGEGQWYTNAVIWAQANGIVTGYNDGTFRPTKEITRQEMAVMLTRYAKLLGMETGSSADLTAYPDAGDVASWAQEAMAWCVEMGLINGVQSGGVSNLKPGNNATRAQFATIMMRYLTMG